MRKMHLAARAPNEGARQLARWIARWTNGCVHLAGVALRLEPSILERLISGELIPGDLLSKQLWERAKINKWAFQSPANRPWFYVAPQAAARQMLKAA